MINQRDLLGHRSPAQVVHPIKFERLPEERVERFQGAGRGTGVRRDGEGGDVRHLFNGVGS